MENKEIKFEELKKSFEVSLRLIEENLAEKLSQENQIENFKNDMNKIKNNILTEYEEEEKDEDDKVKKTNKILNNNDMKLIELLDK